MAAPKGATLITEKPTGPAGATLVRTRPEQGLAGRLKGPYGALTPDEAGARRGSVIDMAADIGIGAEAVENNFDRAATRMASLTADFTAPQAVKPGPNGFSWNFKPVRRELAAAFNERDAEVLKGLTEYLGADALAELPEQVFEPALQVPFATAARETSVSRALRAAGVEAQADIPFKIAALSDGDLKLVSNALLVRADQFPEAVSEAVNRELKIRPVQDYIKSLSDAAQAATIIGVRRANLFNINDFASRQLGIEKLWGMTGGETSIAIEAADRVLAEKNEEDTINLTRVLDIPAAIGQTLLEFAAVPDVTAKIAAFSKLGLTAQRVVSTASRFGLRAALQAPAEGETIGERAGGVALETGIGGVLGAAGGQIANPFLRAGKVAATTGGFMGLTAAAGGDIDEIIETGVLVLGFEAFGAIRRGATGVRVRMERRKLARAIKLVRKNNPDLRGVPDESIGVVLDGYQQIQWWANQQKAGKVTEDVAVRRVNEILDRMAPVTRAIRRSVNTASKEGAQTVEEAVKEASQGVSRGGAEAQRLVGAKPAVTAAEGAKPPAPGAEPVITKDRFRANVRAQLDKQAADVETMDVIAGEHLRSIGGRERGEIIRRGVLPALEDQGPVGLREEAEGAPGGFNIIETPPEELDAIVEQVRQNEGERAAQVVQEFHDAGIETDSTHSNPDEIIVAVREHNLSPENRAALEAAGDITVEDSTIGVLIRVAQPADAVLQTGDPEPKPVREIEKLELGIEKPAKVPISLRTDAFNRTLDLIDKGQATAEEITTQIEASQNRLDEEQKTFLREHIAFTQARKAEGAITAAPAAVPAAKALEVRVNKVAVLAAEVADLEAFAGEIKAKDGTAEEFPADFQAQITESLAAKKELLSKAEAGDEARRVELVKQLEGLIIQQGIGKGRAKDIFMEFGEQSAPVLKTKKMSVAQLEAVIEVVRAERPVRIGHKTVITAKTEAKIQSLFQRMMKNQEMTADAYDAILMDIIGSERIGEKTIRTKEPKFISGSRFITDNQGKDIIQKMLDSAEVIRETESLAAAVRGRPDISPVVKRLDERIAGKKKKDPSSLQSMRFFNQQIEITTETPAYTMYQALIDEHRVLQSDRRKIWESIEAVAPEEFRAIARSEAAQQRISDWISAKSYLEDKPESPEDITPAELKIARRIEEVLEGYEIKARTGKFLVWKWSGQPKSGDNSLPQFDRFKAEIEKAVDIYESQGYEELVRYLRTQEWGVVRSGYEPLQVLSTKLRLHKMPETAVGRSHVRPREDITYNKQEKTIFQRLESYMKQMDTLATLHPKIKAYAGLINEKLDDFKNPQDVKTDIELFLNNIKRFNIDGGWWERQLSRLYAQAVKAVILPDPTKWGRNLLQNAAFETDKSILFDPRNKQITSEDTDYVQTFVLQDKNMMIEFFLSEERALPGLKTLSAMVERMTLYPESDTANRYWSFWAKINQVRRALNESESVQEMMVRAKFSDMTELEQKHALGILARDGEDAMARYVSKVHVDDIHFLYERAQRSPMEMSGVGKVAGNLMLFARGYWERLIRNMGNVFDRSQDTGKRFRSLKLLFATMAGGWLVGEAYKAATGKRHNPYSPLELLAFRPGGLAFATIDTAGEVYSNMVNAIGGDDRAFAALTTGIPKAADMFIPFYDTVIGMIEAQTDQTNVDKQALQAVRELIDSEYVRRGGEEAIKRSAVEKWQRIIAGAGVDMTLEELGRQKKIMTAIKPGDFEGKGFLGIGAGKAEKAFIAKADKFYPELDRLRKDARLGRLDTDGFFRKLQLESIASSLNKIAGGLEKAKSPEARRKLFELADRLLPDLKK